MRFVLAGSSGFLGQALRDHLARQEHEVFRLVRRDPVSENESAWDPYRGVVDQDLVESADVVVNLAGMAMRKRPLTEAYKEQFRNSRVATTRTLAEAVARADAKPAFLAQNGTSYYGDRGEEVLTEDSPEGMNGAFLNGITKEWQAATAPASEAGARVCIMRTGVVLHKAGDAFRILNLVFRAGLGGPVGNGRQYFPTISLVDWVRAVTFLGTHEDCRGAYILSGPSPTTNEEFGRELARMLHRPAVLRVPALPLRKVFPDLSPELLSSVRAEPARLMAAGFEFEHPTLSSRLAAALTD